MRVCVCADTMRSDETSANPRAQHSEQMQMQMQHASGTSRTSMFLPSLRPSCLLTSSPHMFVSQGKGKLGRGLFLAFRSHPHLHPRIPAPGPSRRHQPVNYRPSRILESLIAPAAGADSDSDAIHVRTQLPIIAYCVQEGWGLDDCGLLYIHCARLDWTTPHRTFAHTPHSVLQAPAGPGGPRARRPGSMYVLDVYYMYSQSYQIGRI